MKKFISLFMCLSLVFVLCASVLANPSIQAATLTTNLNLQQNVNLQPNIDLPTINLKDVFINYPKGGESFQIGQPIIIKFTVKTPGLYKVYKSTDMGINWSLLSDVNVVSNSAGNLTYKPTMSGKFRIKVISNSDNTKFNIGNDWTVAASQWDGGLKAAGVLNVVNLSWKTPAYTQGDISTYNIYRSTSPNITAADILTKKVVYNTFPVGGEVTFQDNQVVNLTKYYYKVAPAIGDRPDESIYDVVSATPQGTIVLTIGSKYMLVNGKQEQIDPGKTTAPVVLNGRTYLPIKGIVVAMGGSVFWDGLQQKITVNYKGTTLKLQINSNVIEVNGVAKQMDVAPFISRTGSTMVPLRVVSEYLGCAVNWDGAKQQITILYK